MSNQPPTNGCMGISDNFTASNMGEGGSFLMELNPLWVEAERRPRGVQIYELPAALEFAAFKTFSSSFERFDNYSCACMRCCCVAMTVKKEYEIKRAVLDAFEAADEANLIPTMLRLSWHDAGVRGEAAIAYAFSFSLPHGPCGAAL